MRGRNENMAALKDGEGGESGAARAEESLST
jgi:hypothetical protein